MRNRTVGQQLGVKRAKPIPFTGPNSYLAALPEDKRIALEGLRRVIRDAAPDAEECISFSLPAFRLKGRFFVGYGAAAKHCAFYAGSVVQKFSQELNGYMPSKVRSALPLINLYRHH